MPTTTLRVVMGGIVLVGSIALSAQDASLLAARRPAARPATASLQTARSHSPGVAAPPALPYRAVLDRYCVTCHHARVRSANLRLDSTGLEQVDLAKLTKIGAYHAKLFAYSLEKLDATPDGDGSLLDHLTMIYGSGMSDSNLHNPQKLPILLVGGGGGQVKGGRHLRYPDGTPLTNLYLTVLTKLGMPVERIGDSTGQLEQLSNV
jgi:hypothetical protein